jgi:GT2 family glycosyltransferase
MNASSQTPSVLNAPAGARAARADVLGIVAIGRNEGQRLRRCLESVLAHSGPAVYVDSGSSDGSANLAKQMGVEVLPLDSTKPFTAARARNTGFEHLLAQYPAIEFVQFVDGDSRIAPGWFTAAVELLRAHPDVAIVCGRLREHDAQRSVYTRLCDLEWDLPVGDVEYCGGIMMVRAAAFKSVGGLNTHLVAGEEPELCVRLRAAGWRVVRMPNEMATHDSGMTGFAQYWRRAVRAGHGFAEAAWLQRRTPERSGLRKTASTLFWAAALPIGAAALAWPTRGLSLALLLAYPLQAARIYLHRRQRGRSGRDALVYAAFTVLAKFPQLAGVCKFAARLAGDQRPELIEWK